jgi:ribosome maturation factor RimP
MNNDTQLSMINGLIDGVLGSHPDIFIVQVRLKPANNIKLFIDTNEGISIDKCIRVNRMLYKAIEEAALFPEGDFSLEVSSPGVGEPILLNRQYQKNIGRHFEVTLSDERKFEGTLTSVADDGIVLEEVKGKGKKQETLTHSILFEQIKMAVVGVKF